MIGTIKTILVEKNFGFITPEDGSKDVFFHATSLAGVEFSALKQGDKVSFDVEQSDKGPRAINVAVAA
jgi:CspA family cold shock protein